MCDQPPARWERKFLFALAILLVLLLVPLISRVPRAYVDDSWSSMAGYTLAFEGIPRNPGQMGRGGTGTYLLQPRLFPNVVCAAVYRLIGFGLAQSRLVAATFCAAFVFAVYGVMRRLFGAVAAAGVAVMTAIDPWVFLTGRTCREEIFLAALLWLSWWFLLAAIGRRSARHAFVGGLCIGLACWTHPNTVIFTAAAALALLLVAGPRAFKATWPLYALAGAAIALAPYVAFVAYVQCTSDVSLMDQLGARSGAYTRSLADMLAIEKIRWFNFIRLPLRLPLLLLYLWGIAAALLWGRRQDRLLLVLLAASALLIPLVIKVVHARYLVVLVPAFASLVWRSLPRPAAAGASGSTIGPAPDSPRAARMIAVAMLLVYTGMSLLPTLGVLYAQRGASYDRWVARVAEHIPPGARVMGNIMFWTGLHDRAFISSIPPYDSDWRSVEDAVAHIRSHRPEYLIQASLVYPSVGGVAPREKNLQATTFGRACERVAGQIPAEVLTEFYHRDFGAIRVWRLTWPETPGATSQTLPQGREGL